MKNSHKRNLEIPKKINPAPTKIPSQSSFQIYNTDSLKSLKFMTSSQSKKQDSQLSQVFAHNITTINYKTSNYDIKSTSNTIQKNKKNINFTHFKNKSENVIGPKNNKIAKASAKQSSKITINYPYEQSIPSISSISSIPSISYYKTNYLKDTICGMTKKKSVNCFKKNNNSNIQYSSLINSINKALEKKKNEEKNNNSNNFNIEDNYKIIKPIKLTKKNKVNIVSGLSIQEGKDDHKNNININYNSTNITASINNINNNNYNSNYTYLDNYFLLQNKNSNYKSNNIDYFINNNLHYIILLQRWWKSLYKIIYIQKIVKGFLFRNHIRNNSNIIIHNNLIKKGMRNKYLSIYDLLSFSKRANEVIVKSTKFNFPLSISKFKKIKKIKQNNNIIKQISMISNILSKIKRKKTSLILDKKNNLSKEGLSPINNKTYNSNTYNTNTYNTYNSSNSKLYLPVKTKLFISRNIQINKVKMFINIIHRVLIKRIYNEWFNKSKSKNKSLSLRKDKSFNFINNCYSFYSPINKINNNNLKTNQNSTTNYNKYIYLSPIKILNCSHSKNNNINLTKDNNKIIRFENNNCLSVNNNLLFRKKIVKNNSKFLNKKKSGMNLNLSKQLSMKNMYLNYCSFNSNENCNDYDLDLNNTNVNYEYIQTEVSNNNGLNQSMNINNADTRIIKFNKNINSIQ